MKSLSIFAKYLLSIACITSMLSFSACDNNVAYHETHRVDEEGWSQSDSIVYNLDIDDTLSTYICFLDMRNRVDYPYSNLYIFLKTIYPDGSVSVDTNMEFVLAAPDGRWLGKTSGRYNDGRYPLCYFHFPEQGKYQFVIRHAMRDSLLKGMKDIAIHIEHTPNAQ